MELSYSIQEEIKSRLKVGNACYYSVQNLLSSSLLSKKLKIKIYRIIIYIKKLEILPLKSQYILSTILFVVKNKELFTTNQEIHNINTRCYKNLHPPVSNLAIFQKGVSFSGIKLFNHLPPNIKILSNEINLFKLALTFILLMWTFGRAPNNASKWQMGFNSVA